MNASQWLRSALSADAPAAYARPEPGIAGPEADAARGRLHPGRSGIVLDLALLTLFTLSLRLIHLGHVPEIDEFYHVLAGRSLNADGTLDINGYSSYTRARLFTFLVAGSFQLFGESLAAARLPALVAGVLLVPAVYLWVRTVAGRGAAIGAALLLSTYPSAILLSQISRFYTLHALLVWLGAVGVYALVMGRPHRPALVAAGTALAWALALHLQILTVVAFGGVALWAVLVTFPRALRWASLVPGRRRLVAGVAVAAVVIAVVGLASGVGERLIANFGYADMWAEEHRNNPRFYHWIFSLLYPTLWTLLPFVLVVAFVSAPRPAFFSACVFLTAFVAQSLAAWKHERYLFYATPMMFVLFGIATAQALAWTGKALDGLLAATFGRVPALLRRVTAVGLLVAAALFTLAGNGILSNAFRTASGRADAEAPENAGDWEAAAERLRPVADSSAVLISSAHTKALYYFRRIDAQLLRTSLPGSSRDHTGERIEGGPSVDVGSPVISTAESLQRYVRCYPSGLVLIEHGVWRRDWGVPAATAEWISANLDSIPLPRQWRLHAYQWHRADAAQAPACTPFPAAPLSRPSPSPSPSP